VNFLAHCLIGARAADETRPELVVGGFLGDFIKGTLPVDLPRGLALGVQLHRRIDAYSNQHPGIRISCGRFPQPLRRMAPIFVDIIADHCLARQWSEFSSEPISTFTRRTYEQIAGHKRWLPAAGRRLLRYMSEEDLLASYRHTEVMQQGLRSITRRLDREHLNPALLETAIGQLEWLEEDFMSYFPDMLVHGRNWVSESQG